MKLPGVPLAGKVFLICVGLALVVSLATNGILYRGAKQSLRGEVRSKIEGIAGTAALQVDPELHNSIRADAGESSEAYRKVKVVLAAIRKANPGICHIYTARKTDKLNVWQTVVDAGADSTGVLRGGEKFDVRKRPRMRGALFRPCSDEQPTRDAGGFYLSAYAPIRDESGRVEAVLGIDMFLEDLRTKGSPLRQAAYNNFLFALLLASVLSLLVTRILVKRVHTFTDAAERIRQGDLNFQIPASGSDEISTFADAFNGMIGSLKHSRERLMEQSTKDFLTGLFNHMYFHERLAAEIERAERYGHNLCLLILDLDRFKSINDNFSHPVGDSILRQLAEVLKESIRSIDVAARYGGDEFAIILPETDEQTGLQAAERIRSDVESHLFYAVPQEEFIAGNPTLNSHKTISITMTAGIACYPDHHSTREGLVMAADIALCRAKHVARNSVCPYDTTISGDTHVDPLDLYRVLKDPNTAAIESLAAAMDAKDHCTGGHSDRVTRYALLMGDALGTDSQTLDALKVAGLLHDLGKIGVPDSILNKPSGLTQREQQVIRQHPSIGESILKRAPQFDLIVPAVLFHHERWDGDGYPNRLAGESIPLVARILAIADAFDAMTSDRPYRRAMSIQEAIFELRANSGKQFDPTLVEMFIERLSFHERRAA